MNDKEYLLDDLISHITINNEKLKDIVVQQNASVSLYFLYHIPRFKADSYLLTNERYVNVQFTRSFSSVLIKEIQDDKEIEKVPILSKDELNEVINYALNISEIHELLNDKLITSVFKSLAKHEILGEILTLFNEWQYEKILEYINQKNLNLFQNILKISLLSIPQLKSSISQEGETNDDKDFLTGIDKENQIRNDYIDKYKKNILTNLEDKLFLIITLVEGFLWSLDNNGKLYNFYFDNLYKVLVNRKNNKNKPIIQANYFYLNNFKFYFYGNIQTSLEERNKVKKTFSDILNDNLSNIILFSKSIISRLNIDSIQSWYGLSNPLIPQSIAHGITSVWLPDKIGFFEKSEKNELKLLGKAFKINEGVLTLEQLNDPWCLYSECEDFKPSFEDFNHSESDVSSNREGRQILIKTKNAINQTKYIAIEFSSKDNIYNTHIKNNFESYKYAFKAFIEKLQLIHRSASLNLCSDFWYKKAFCSLYRKFDELRYKEQYENESSYNDTVSGSPFRSWEENYFREFLKRETTIVIYDIGASYGRLEKNIFEQWSLSDKIEIVYAIDQNQEYLREIKDYSGKVKKMHCDFRSIGIIQQKKADLVCFMHTAFGYFEDDIENKSVLKKAYDILKVGGTLIIDQFNPMKELVHKGVASFFYPNIMDPTHKLIKTSNIKTAEVNSNFGRYYGSYMYFDITDNKEKLIKCDTYDIKLYTEKWFKEVLSLSDDCIFSENKDNGYTLFIKIIKKQSKETILSTEEVHSSNEEILKYKEKIMSLIDDNSKLQRQMIEFLERNFNNPIETAFKIILDNPGLTKTTLVDRFFSLKNENNS